MPASDADFMRAYARTLLRIAEKPHRRASDDAYTALRELAFMSQAVALALEDDDALFTEEPTSPGNPSTTRTRVGVPPAGETP